eukprot:8680872-Pyramimonas_sp.AAC.1
MQSLPLRGPGAHDAHPPFIPAHLPFTPTYPPFTPAHPPFTPTHPPFATLSCRSLEGVLQYRSARILY